MCLSACPIVFVTVIRSVGLSVKPIFHCDAKYLASGVGVGQCPRRQNFALEIPTCWYILALPNTKICVIPDASQWNIGCVGSQRKMLALAMYISCFLCRFHLRLVPNGNPISSGIWTLLLVTNRAPTHVLKVLKFNPYKGIKFDHLKSL